jgi:hypothetical protein
MTPQERQLVDELFDRLSQVESAPRDPDASNAIAQGSRKAPNAVYALVQTVLLQDEALKRANHRIQELEQGQAGEQNQSGGFLDSMRDTILGQSQSRGSVPNVPPPVPNRPVWNSGQVLQQSQSPGHYDQGPYDQRPYGQGSYGQGSYGQGSYGQGYGQGPSGQPYGASQSPFGGGGGSFLGTAAAAAAGMVGGSLLLNSIRSMMGGRHYGVADAGATSDKSSNPQSDQSDSALARDAGINDIGSSGQRGVSDDGARAGLFDQASNDDDDSDRDSDGFDGDDGDSDYA